jgi:hypothetical protein
MSKSNLGSISDSSSSSENDDEDEMEHSVLKGTHLQQIENECEETGPFTTQSAFNQENVDVLTTSQGLETVVSHEVLHTIVHVVQDSKVLKSGQDSSSKTTCDKAVDVIVEAVSAKRMRANSDLDKYREKMASGSRKEVEERETPEKWRNRLWPSKAITSFCRILLRCKPPASVPGERLVMTNKGVSQLGAHWQESELPRINVNFDSAPAHNAAFFLLVVEECRDSVTKMDDFETVSTPARTGTVDRKEQSAFNRGEGRYSSGTNGWFDCEITGVVAESEFGRPSTAAVDPRLGSVWVVSVAIIKPCSPDSVGKGWNGSTYSGGGSGSSGGARDLNQFPLPKDPDLSGGDLMVMHSSG